MNDEQVRHIVEAALMAAGRPLSIDTLIGLFGDEARPDRGQIRGALNALIEQYEDRGIELVEVASGFRIQVRQNMSDWLSRLWQERPPRYSRALMETLALIAYRQPITRGEIEDVRGVAVSTNIVRTLMERGWIRVVGHRDVPGKPAMFGTTREFLDYFGLKRLDELPSLAELRDLDSLNVELDLGFEVPGAESDAPEAGQKEQAGQGEVHAILPEASGGATASAAEGAADAGEETASETGQESALETGQEEHPNAGRA
ncbi:MAG: SMC-Scp complex subunit ScpB [Gammaproteobacteria bacterium]|jgi:segregation and condensation protein B